MLPRSLRMRANKCFQATYKKRKYWSGQHLILYFNNSRALEALRFGIVISKKSARHAHQRNRIKRQLSEICRTNLYPRLSLSCSGDILLVVKSSAVEATFSELENDILRLITEAGLL